MGGIEMKDRLRKARPGEPLQAPPDEFSAWDDFKFTLGGLFVLAVPLIFIALGGLVIWDLFVR